MGPKHITIFQRDWLFKTVKILEYVACYFSSFHTYDLTVVTYDLLLMERILQAQGNTTLWISFPDSNMMNKSILFVSCELVLLIDFLIWCSACNEHCPNPIT